MILRVRKQLDYANNLVEQNVNFVLEQNPVSGAVILLLSYKTQKELSQKSPSLISPNYHGQILRRTQIKLEQLGYRIETAYITSSLLKREGYYKKSLKDAILVIPIGHKED